MVARVASPGQDDRNSRGDGQLSRRSAGCACEIGRPRWQNQIGPRPRRWTPQPAVSDCPGRPKSGHHSATFHRRGLRFVGFALTRLCRNDSSRPGKRLNIGYAAALACRSASGTAHNTHCPFGRSSHINSFRADNSPCRDPSARNLCQTMCRCVLSRCFTVTLTAIPHLRARAGSQCASSQASFTPTPPLRL